MKKILIGLVACIASAVLAIDSMVVKNATNGTVFGLSYETGSATGVLVGALTVTGPINAGSTALVATVTSSATVGTLTVQTNATIAGRLTAVTINQATISSNATVGGTLGVTGVATFTAAPNLTSQALATGTVYAGVPLLWNGATTNPVFIAVTIGTTNYVIPAYKQP